MDTEDMPKMPILSQKEPILSQKEPILSQKEPLLSKKEPMLSLKEPILPKKAIKAVEEKVVFQLSQPYSQNAGILKTSKKRSSTDRPDQTMLKKVRSEDPVLQPFSLQNCHVTITINNAAQ
jgi:hypothetical protein